MPRKRKFNVKRHPCGKPKIEKRDDLGSEHLLFKRAKAFGADNARDPLACDQDLIGNLLLLGRIGQEQHKALSKLKSMYDAQRSLREIAWQKFLEVLPEAVNETPPPKPRPKVSSLEAGGRSCRNQEFDFDRFDRLNQSISFIDSHIDQSVIQLAAYDVLLKGALTYRRERFYDSINWLVQHFQKTPS